MRLLAALSTLAFLALAALFGRDLWRSLNAPASTQGATQTSTAEPTLDHATPGATRDSGDPALAPPARSRHWPPLFGEKQPPRPQATPPVSEAEPQPPKPPKPPLDSLGYQLTGMVQAERGTWAIVSHPSGEQLVRQGDTLREGVIVQRIDAQGLWLSRDGDAPELLEFSE